MLSEVQKTSAIESDLTTDSRIVCKEQTRFHCFEEHGHFAISPKIAVMTFCVDDSQKVREKAGGRYAVGFSLQLPARLSGSAASSRKSEDSCLL
jgi:hypothetical protein